MTSPSERSVVSPPEPIGSSAPVDVVGRTERFDASSPLGEPFEAFYRRHYRSVVSLVHALSGSRTAAEELAQDAFVAAHRQWSTVERHPDPEAWVKRVAINFARSWGRRKLIEAKALGRLGRERPRVTEMSEPAERLWRHVRQLSPNQAAAIALHYHDDRSVESIAGVLGCSPATVRVHLHRGRQALAAALDLDADDETDVVPNRPRGGTP